jgi:hypothetical protein
MPHRLLGLLGSLVLGLAACGGGGGDGAPDGGGGGGSAGSGGGSAGSGGGGGSAGSGGGSAGSGGGSAGSGGTGGGAPGFITGTVDGVVIRADFDPKAGVMGVLDGRIWMTAGTNATVSRGWNVYAQNQVGMHDCGQGWVGLFDGNGDPRSDQGGNCSINVTSAAPAIGDVIEGTFTATLKSTMPARTVTVTDGAFHIVRTHP